MSNEHTTPNISSQIFASFMMSYSIYKTWKPTRKPSPKPLTHDQIPSNDLRNKLRTDPAAIKAASVDYGNLVQEEPSAVLCPTSVHDIVDLVKLSNTCPAPFAVSARGRGHSVRGQAAARGGVVVDMSSLGGGIRISWSQSLGYYADVGGDRMWVDVLRAGLEHGLAPVSWTDYLHLTVGGTLSNAGISGQSFLYGPQITNVLELDVITGKGDLLTCSKDVNSELFFGVLGGLGQFGIITRARIVLQKAPTRAKWVRLIYSDFRKFTRDQERLISWKQGGAGPNYVEGSLITDQSHPNNWRSSFYSPSDLSKLFSLLQDNGGLLYSLEVVKYYDHHHHHAIDQEMDSLLRDLSFIPGTVFKKDVPLVDFLNRVASSEDQNDVAHPWLNLFVPKSRIGDFNAGVFVNIIRANNNLTSGPILFYPFHRQKWDERMSAVIPDDDGEEIFYTLGLLTSCRPTESQSFDRLNSEILDFCDKSGIQIKQYLPSYDSKEEWEKHFGPKWDTFQQRKLMFDPRMILSPGQRIFNTHSDSNI